MKNHYCEKEQQVATAVRCGTLPDELKGHVAACDICAEVMVVASLLQHEIVPATPTTTPPDAALIWRRGQETARRKAVARATAPIRIARICASVVALLSILWAATSFTMPSWFPDLGSQHLGILNRSLSITLTPTTVLGIGGSLICMLLSSWYVLRQE